MRRARRIMRARKRMPQIAFAGRASQAWMGDLLLCGWESFFINEPRLRSLVTAPYTARFPERLRGHNRISRSSRPGAGGIESRPRIHPFATPVANTAHRNVDSDNRPQSRETGRSARGTAQRGHDRLEPAANAAEGRRLYDV